MYTDVVVDGCLKGLGQQLWSMGINIFDAAVGVLLDGIADCDGYSDAFYLLGNLAGFTVRLVHGTTNNPFEGNPNHMWNEIAMDGEWYAVDVTWDDYEDESRPFSPYCIYFNVGADRLGRTHFWDDSARPHRRRQRPRLLL